MTERERVANALATLGGSADEVAGRLLAEGCFGLIGDGNRCPVHGWAERTTGADCHAGPVHVVVFDDALGGGDLTKVAMPGAVREFLGRFDRGCYPALVL